MKKNLHFINFRPIYHKKSDHPLWMIAHISYNQTITVQPSSHCRSLRTSPPLEPYPPRHGDGM